MIIFVTLVATPIELLYMGLVQVHLYIYSASVFYSINRQQLLLPLGSTSVHLHVLSPASQGLFQRAILASGSVYNIWSDDDHLPTLFEFGKLTEELRNYNHNN